MLRCTAKKAVMNWSEMKIECPHCGEMLSGWHQDPRGGDTDCDYCNKVVTIPEDIEVVYQ